MQKSRGSVVVIATGCGLDDWVKNFHFSLSSRLNLGSTQLPNYLCNLYRGPFPWG
jgi:hypothetical protein